jgi:hypothetical protein
MKTAISLEDDPLLQADRFAIAIEEYLRERRYREIVGQLLNKAYAAGPRPEERRTVAGMKRRFRSAIRESW